MDNIQKLIISSYLHDIGKLAIRAGWFRDKFKQNYNVAHAQYVNDFIDVLNLGKDWADIGTIASHHHGKDIGAVLNGNFSDDIKFLTWCVYMADNLSAKEREEANEKEDFSHIRFPLGKIFDVVKFIEEKNKKLEEIDKNNGWYPKKLTNFDGEYGSNVDYDELADNFFEDLKKFLLINKEIVDFKNFVYKLDLILQNYLTLVPSDTYQTEIADISLYDHSKTVVIFALFLYEVFKAYENKKELFKLTTNQVLEKIKELNKNVILIGGDFAGIQKYIFDGIKKSSKASKRLRARSFIVQILSEAVLHYILNKFDLISANVLINAGGKFVIFSPKEINLGNLQSEINEFLIKNYPGVKFILDEIEIGFDDILNNFQFGLAQLYTNLSSKKFKVYNIDNLKLVFSNKDVSGKVLCKYCGKNYIEKEVETNDDICDMCKLEVGLGDLMVKDIKDKGYLFFDIEKEGKFNFNIKVKINGSNVDNIKVDLLDNGQIKLKINNWDLSQEEFNDREALIIGKSLNLYVPSNKEKAKVISFEKLTENNKTGYISVIKGDVDNMSILLRKGFGRFYTISRLLTFSRFLELFFGKVLHNWLENNWKDVYTVFSGGDDFVFVVPFKFNDGKDIIDFLRDFYNFWAKYVNYNKYFHFSVGIALAKPKQPIKDVINLAEDLLSEAKNNFKQSFNNINNKTDALDRLSNFVVAGFEEGFYTKYGDESSLEEVLTRIDDIKRFELDNYINQKEIPTNVVYKFYITLKEVKELLEQEKWDEIILKYARLLYMLNRDLEFEDKVGFKRWFQKEFGSIKDKDKENVKLASYLLKLTYRLYKQRDSK